MTKVEIVKILKEQAELATTAQAQAVYDSLFGIIKATLQQGNTVTISGFGSFKTVQRMARKGRNPSTGEEMIIPASKTVKFIPAKSFKETL